MNWYKNKHIKISSHINAPKAIFDSSNRKPHNDYARANIDYEEQGYWYISKFEYIPIDQIDYKEWDQGRLEDNLQKIDETKKTYPVYLSFDDKTDRFSVGDGNHRCAASKKLGYTHIPAIVSRRVITPPPSSPDVERERMKDRAWQMVYFIKNIKRVDLIDPSNTTEKEIVLDIGQYNKNSTHIYKAVISQNKVILMQKDKPNKEFSGGIQQMAQWIANNIEDME